MSNFVKCFAIALALLISQPVFARGSVQAKSPHSAMYVTPSGATPTLPQIRDAVGSAGAMRGWRVVAEDAGSMTLYNNVRGKHEVTVRVEYDQKGFKVVYVSSVNMNYKKRGDLDYIHPKYNLWVDRLVQDILAKVALVGSGGGN